MTLYKLPPMPWQQLNENHWQAVTALGVWEVFFDPDDKWQTERWGGSFDALQWRESCKDAEDGKRMAEAERDRILTASLEIAGLPERIKPVTVWGVARKTHECYGQGSYDEEQRICRMGSYGTGKFPPVFTNREDAQKWAHDNKEGTPLTVVELQLIEKS